MADIEKIIFGGKARQFKLAVIDLVTLICVAVFFLLFGGVRESYLSDSLHIYALNVALLAVVSLACRLVFKIYRNVLRYTNTRVYFTMCISDAIATVLTVVLSFGIGKAVSGFFLGIWPVTTIASLYLLASLFSRFAYRLIYKYFHTKTDAANVPKTPIAIIGAGQLGAHLADELLASPKAKYSPQCFIDADKSKINKNVCGLPVFSPDDAQKAMSSYGFTEVVIAISGLSGEKYQRLWERYSAFGCKVKVYDSPVTEASPDGSVKKGFVIRDFSIEDLLFRKPLDINNQSEFDYYKGKTVLVTGGGGSIGSELCRQLAKCNVKKLVIFDIYENNAYDIQQELVRKYGAELDLTVEIGSVRDVDRLNCIFKNYKPQIVFHAAAHKHVPLMEQSGCEAIKNNVLGTYNTANMAEKYGAEKFILISTDKAVNPTNIMGASKRLCEMVIQCRYDSKTNFAAVRFGNVLGSNGSVIPLFKRQIMEGGPVTITDKRIIRYFMTIPEASQLVIQAGAKAEKGELFVLDMGQPVRIYDLAVNMIKLMGFVPGEDIEIKEIGLRPGEKLYEELLMKSEDLEKTDNDMIFIERDTPLTREQMEEKIGLLRTAVELSKDEVRSEKIREVIRNTVPTFVDPEVINRTAEQSAEMQNVKENVTV